MSNQRLINAGATLANIAFNLAQHDPGEFTARDIAALDQARKDWDAARSEPDATPAPGAPGQEAAAVQAVGADARDAARYRFQRDNHFRYFEPSRTWEITDGAGKRLRAGVACSYEEAIDAAGAGEKTS